MDNVNPVADTKPNAVPQVPEDWAVLGAMTGYNPKPAEALRLFIVGPSGEGKTTFESSIPNNLVLDFDDGADAVPGGRAVRLKIKGYSQYNSIIDKLVADSKANKRHWDRISFDTIDEMVAMVKHQIETESNVKDITEVGSMGHGYNLILERLWSRVIDLEHAGYTWSFLGHMKTKTEVNPATKKEETKIRESVYPMVAKKILTKSDFKLTVYCLPQTIEKTKQQKLPSGQVIEVPAGSETKLVYFADSLTREAWDNKGRGVPTMERRFEVPLIGGWDVFASRYTEAVEAARKIYQ